MRIKFVLLLAGLVILVATSSVASESPQHTFGLGTNDFLLDGRPFQIRAGEIHPGRIPKEYWRHRIRMAKATGLNTIAAYIFWNYHEIEEGHFDFKTGNRDLAEFFRLVREEGMWLFLRPGPYCCAEYDFGGIPPYLLRSADLKVRCLDPRYNAAAERYCRALAKVVRPWQITEGGPIIMLQVENEYGSYVNDRAYLQWLRDLWRKLGVTVPFSTGDGATPYMLEQIVRQYQMKGETLTDRQKQWLAAARSALPVPEFQVKTMTEFSHDPEKLYAWRDRMGDLIDQSGVADANPWGAHFNVRGFRAVEK